MANIFLPQIVYPPLVVVPPGPCFDPFVNLFTQYADSWLRVGVTPGWTTSRLLAITSDGGTAISGMDENNTSTSIIQIGTAANFDTLVTITQSTFANNLEGKCVAIDDNRTIYIGDPFGSSTISTFIAVHDQVSDTPSPGVWSDTPDQVVDMTSPAMDTVPGFDTPYRTIHRFVAQNIRVSADGNVLVAVYYTRQAILILTKVVGVWTPTQIIQFPDSPSDVDMVADGSIIAAAHAGDGSFGSVGIYSTGDFVTWSLVQQVDTSSSGYSNVGPGGGGVAISNDANVIALGAISDNFAEGLYGGRVYIIRRSGGVYSITAGLIATPIGTDGNGQQLGYWVSLSKASGRDGKYLVVTAPLDPLGTESDIGGEYGSVFLVDITGLSGDGVDISSGRVFNPYFPDDDEINLVARYGSYMVTDDCINAIMISPFAPGASNVIDVDFINATL